MTLALIVWLVMTVLPALKVIGIVLFIIGILGVLFGLILWSDSDDNRLLNFTRGHLKWAIPVILLSIFSPSKETAWYMVGAYATQTVAQSETVQGLASDSVDVLKSLIKRSKEYLDDDQKADLDKAAKAPAPAKQDRT